MATTVKPLALKNIGNVPDWVNKRTTKDVKKEVSKAPRRPTTQKPKTVSVPHQTVPAVAKPPVIPQPITEEVKDPIENGVQGPPAGAKARKIYSREFLIKFKHSASAFPAGTLTPQDIIAQYNKDFEIKERTAHENSSLTPGRHTVTVPSAPMANAPTQPTTETEVPHVAPPAEKKIKKKIEGDKKVFKLRGLEATDESILRSPLFRASANKLQSNKRSSSPSLAPSDDKENPIASSKLTKPSSLSSINKRRAASPATKHEAASIKTQKLPTTSSSLIPTPAPVSAPTIPTTPAPVPTTTPVSIPLPPTEPMETVDVKTETEPVESVVQDTKQDPVDALTKKLKSVMKETDPRRLAQRQKQIEYGKATLGYKDYTKLTAKSKRKREDPKTPNKYQVCSKRSWDGQIRKWRRMLHFYDPADLQNAQACADLDLEGEADAKPDMAITAEDILAEENALKE